MSFVEKRNWIYAAVIAVSYAIYVVIILGRAQGTPIAEVPYAATMFWTIGGAIVATIVCSILAGIFSPRDAGKSDERDASIYRYGEYIGYLVFSIGILGALGLTMAKFAHFWIGNAIYLAFVLAALISTTVKLVAYRRGFQQW